jgi:DNA-binding MarR family transcriptional regulator
MTTIAVDLDGLTSFGLMSSISKSQKALQKMLCVCLGHHDLTLPQWQVIGLLIDGSKRPTELAQMNNMKTPQISLIALEIKKVHPSIITELLNQEDARTKKFALTETGQDFAAMVEAKLQICIQRELAKKVAPDNLQTYLEVTEFIGENVKHL